jgi:carbamoyl-phosphate synthase small subunit
MKPIEAVLVLEGIAGAPSKEYRGFLFGASVSAASIRASIAKAAAQKGSSEKTADRGFGEVVFNTSMTGYQEILTDPSYYGEIICMTCPHIGNTGINPEDMESSKVWTAGFVVHELPRFPSNWRSTMSLDSYLKERGIPGIYGVDTRALTRHLRNYGVVKGVILPLAERAEAEKLLAELPSFEGRDMIREVSTPKAYDWNASSKAPKEFKVVALDYGIKWNLLRSLEEAGCKIKVLPADAKASEVLAEKPHGVFLSNGPGDPAAAPYAVETVKGLLGKVPLFGVCMGHQILGLAVGGKTYKLKFGHRGGNQPVLDKATGHVEISSHNHGYSVDGGSLPEYVTVGHHNLNDKTCEGLDIPSKHAFSVQYHPEASPGPHDSMELFNRFAESMRRFHVSKVS